MVIALFSDDFKSQGGENQNFLKMDKKFAKELCMAEVVLFLG